MCIHLCNEVRKARFFFREWVLARGNKMTLHFPFALVTDYYHYCYYHYCYHYHHYYYYHYY